MRNMTNNTMYIVQELHAFVFNAVALNKIVFKISLKSISYPSKLLLHSSTNLSTILFLHLQFL